MTTVTLIETDQHKLGVYTASALISEFRKGFGYSALFVFGSGSDNGQQALYNRNLHWIAELTDDAREAALLAVANYLDAENKRPKNVLWDALSLVELNHRLHRDGSRMMTLQSLSLIHI